MASIKSSLPVLLLLLQLSLLAQVLGFNTGFDTTTNRNTESRTTATYVDNEVCERLGLICGRNNGTLMNTRCCEIRVRRTGRLERHRCCNPELSGVIAGSVTGGVLLIFCCIGCWTVGCVVYCSRSAKRRPIYNTKAVSQEPTASEAELPAYKDLYHHNTPSGQQKEQERESNMEKGHWTAEPQNEVKEDDIPNTDDIQYSWNTTH